MLAFTVLTGCSKNNENTKTPNEAENREERGPRIKQEVYSFKVEGFDRGKKLQWGLEGESANVIEDLIKIKNLKAVYRGDEGTFTVFADKAVYNKTTRDVELIENIVGRTKDGGELTTDRANYNSEKEEITTKSYVVVKRENITCAGRGLITKPKLKWAAFQSEVDVDFGREEDRRIICDGPFEIDHEKHTAVFYNNVRIIDKKTETLTDKLTVYLDPETNAIARVVTEGNVEIVHRGDVGDLENMGKMNF